MAKNPHGTVPILELGNVTYLTESLVIMEYLEEKFPEPCMIGKTPLERAYTQQAERHIEWHIFYNVAKIFFHTHHFFSDEHQVPPITETARVKLPSALKSLDQSLKHSGFVIANQPTIADCTLLACIYTCKCIDIDLGAGCKNIQK